MPNTASAIDAAVEFDVLFQRHFEPLRRQIARMVDCEHVAEELVQDLFLKLWNARAAIAVRGDVVSYLRRAARNRALDWLRRKNLEHEWEEHARLELSPVFGGGEPGLHEPDDRTANLLSALSECLNSMPARRREVCELRWRQDLGPTRIASRLGLSVKTVESHLTLGVKQLRARLRAA